MSTLPWLVKRAYTPYEEPSPLGTLANGAMEYFTPASIGGGMLGGLGITGAAQGWLGGIRDNILPPRGGLPTRQGVNKEHLPILKQLMKMNRGTPVKNTTLGDMMGPYWHPDQKHVGLPNRPVASMPTRFGNLRQKLYGASNPTARPDRRYLGSMGVLAHDFGHSKQPGALIKATNTARAFGGGAGTMYALGSDSDTHGFYGALAGTAANLPHLGVEYDASRRGANMLQTAARTAGKTLPRALRMSPYMGLPTYALMAAAPMAAYGGKKLFGGYSQE